MKVSYHWLKQYVDFDLPPGELCERLTGRGLEIEGYEVAADDFVIEIEIKANRPDLLSHIGVAREISALICSPLRIPQVSLRESQPDAASLAEVEVVDGELCPRYTARIIRNVRVKPSPIWLQRYLEALGLRPVNNVVDLTNFVLLECGQPLHAFDYDKLAKHRIVVRPARAGEKMTFIDRVVRQFKPGMLLIADTEKPIALAGVMGGLDTEVTDSTTTVLLESAYFQPQSIRRTAGALAIQTDASYRFERGVDPQAVEWASRRCAALIADVAGGETCRGVVDVNCLPLASRSVSLRLPRLKRVLGAEVPPEEVKSLLGRIGFTVQRETDSKLEFDVPSFRADVVHEIDLVEEVARLYGYERFPLESTLPVRVAALPRHEQVRRAVRDLLVALGYTEVTCSSLLSVEWAERPTFWAGAGALKLSNPLNPNEAALRRVLLPSLLQVKRTNQDRGTPRTEIFEIARVYLEPERRPLPQEKTCLAILEENSFYELKGTVESLLERLGLDGRVQMEPARVSLLDPAATVRMVLNGELLGYLGRTAHEEAAAFDLRSAPWAAELDFDLLTREANLERSFRELPKFPASDRDLAVVIDGNVLWKDVLACVREAGGQWLEDVAFFDLYQGKQVPEGKKSLAFSIRFRSHERTLRSEEVDAAVERIVTALRERLRATLRGR